MIQRTFNKLMSLLVYPCTKITALVSQSLDEELPLLTRVRVRAHLAMCTLCRRFMEQLHFIRNVLRRNPERLDDQETPPSSGLSQEARDRLKRALTPPNT